MLRVCVFVCVVFFLSLENLIVIHSQLFGLFYLESDTRKQTETQSNRTGHIASCGGANG